MRGAAELGRDATDGTGATPLAFGTTETRGEAAEAGRAKFADALTSCRTV